ncbi:MAG: glycoside hydrolase family 3 protein [Kordiimonadaceae bacterium]|nr:glycoside hydrolase family 3 protein [Kordiimonadaceae bacterium]MBO6567488.1 glycoside hydrolase family 3 protein [Kordiimonadaceae bacterium]MBO6963298.1 glycoside hydrolase family 3 protein [Kordiimonadaceae bacterium]
MNTWRTPRKGLCAAAVAGLLFALAPVAAAENSASPWPELQSPLQNQDAIEARIDEIMSRMTLKQKVGQMIQAERNFITPEQAAEHHIGSILNGGGSWPGGRSDAPVSAWLEMADAFYDASMDTSNGRLAIPIIWGTDAVHGHNNVWGATVFPHNIGLGAANNPELMRQIGAATAREVAATGIDWTFAPTLAVAQNLRWGRTYESYSANPEIVSRLGDQMVLGIQGVPNSTEFLSVNHVLATAKHFVGDGGTMQGIDQGDTVLPEDEFFRLHGQPYVPALDAGVQSVMASFSSWNGRRMSANKYLLTDILKDRMGFDGLIVSDWNAHMQLAGCAEKWCTVIINAGVDLIMVPEEWQAFQNSTIGQVENGDIPMERIDDAVRRILRVKLRAGMFDDGRPSDHALAGRVDVVGHADHRAVARQAVRESLVLLKNESVLPLNPSTNLFVGGSAADDPAIQAGGWTVSWQGRDNKRSDYKGFSTLLQGFEQAMDAVGGSVVKSDETPVDAAVIAFGETPYAEFQGDLQGTDFNFGDSGDLDLMRAMKAKGVPVVAVFLTGRPRGIDEVLELADAVVVAWLPGSEGAGVADVLLSGADGAAGYDFKGKLPFSWVGNESSGSKERLPLGYGLTYQN